MVLPRSVLIPPPFEIRTAARLHLGLLDTRDPFGGVGLMLAQPATRIRVQAAQRFEARGPAQERIESVAARFAAYWQLAEPPACAIEVVERPPPHAGLGSGTQLAMAVAEAKDYITGAIARGSVVSPSSQASTAAAAATELGRTQDRRLAVGARRDERRRRRTDGRTAGAPERESRLRSATRSRSRRGAHSPSSRTSTTTTPPS